MTNDEIRLSLHHDAIVELQKQVGRLNQWKEEPMGMLGDICNRLARLENSHKCLNDEFERRFGKLVGRITDLENMAYPRLEPSSVSECPICHKDCGTWTLTDCELKKECEPSEIGDKDFTMTMDKDGGCHIKNVRGVAKEPSSVSECCKDEPAHYCQYVEPKPTTTPEVDCKDCIAQNCDTQCPTPKPSVEKPKTRYETDDVFFLRWLRDRLINVYGESSCVDFVHKLTEIIGRIDSPSVEKCYTITISRKVAEEYVKYWTTDATNEKIRLWNAPKAMVDELKLALSKEG